MGGEGGLAGGGGVGVVEGGHDVDVAGADGEHEVGKHWEADFKSLALMVSGATVGPNFWMRRAAAMLLPDVP